MEEGIVVRTPRDRFGTVMTERVQHNGVVGLTMECESTSHRGDPERGSVETFSVYFCMYNTSIKVITDCCLTYTPFDD